MRYREREIERIISETMNLIVSDTWRNTDGGWGAAPGRSSDVWSTAEVSELMSKISRSLGINVTKVHLQTILEAADKFIVEHQNQDGGWGVESGKSDATGTELAMITLAQLDQHKYYANLRSALEWMAQNQHSGDAGWGLKGGGSISSLFCTCFGCIALNNLPEVLKTPIVEQRLLGLALTYLQRAKNTDGGWGKILNAPSTGLETAYAVFTLTAVFGLHSMVGPSIAWLKQHQNQDGGWGEAKGGSVEATAAAIRAFLAFEANPDSKYIRHGIDYLLHYHNSTKGGWSNQKKQNPTTWATYYVLEALAAYIISCREAGGQKLSKWEQTKAFLFSPKATVLFGILLVLTLLILFLQYISLLETIVGPYSGLFNTLATIGTLLSLLWGVGLYFVRRRQLP